MLLKMEEIKVRAPVWMMISLDEDELLELLGKAAQNG